MRRSYARPALVLALAALALAGCTRRFFRIATDKDTVCLLAEKDQVPAWKLEQWWVYPHPLARFADPTNPDRPPMPPDDPATARLAPTPQKPGKAGVDLVQGDGYRRLLAEYDRFTRAMQQQENQEPLNPTPTPRDLQFGPPPPPAPTPTPAELTPASFQETAAEPAPTIQQVQVLPGPATNPADRDPTQTDAEAAYRIRLEQASELGLINSREFQDRREDLYLAALPVSLERFAFAAQFFATEELIREYTGPFTPDGRGNRWRSTTTTGVTKLFPTGALLLYQMANQIIVQMAGERVSVTTPSRLSLDITQPLLRGGGRAVTLEPLTQAERNLVYSLRSYARFRKEYYVYIAGGGQLSFDRFATGAAVTAARLSPLLAPAQGYLPTVLFAGILRNERANVAALESILKLFQAIAEGGDVSQLQVDQVEQQLLSGRSTVLQREQDLRDALDRFKLQLGIPTDLPIDLDDGPLVPLTRHIVRFQQVFDEFDRVRILAEEFDGPEQIGQLRSELRKIATTARLVVGTRFVNEFPTRWRILERLPDASFRDRLSELADRRRLLLGREADAEAEGQDWSAREKRELARVEEELAIAYFEEALRLYEAKPWQGLPQERQTRARAALFRDVLNRFLLVMSEARTERLNMIRTSWPELPPVVVCGVDLLKATQDEAYTVVAQTALTNRFDLLNVRAQLVDAWRLIAVQANSLLGVANVTYHVDSTSPPNRSLPFAFSGDRTRHQLIMDGELPLVRRFERATYRATLIAYQRQRRQLQAAEDFVLNDVRIELRSLRVLAEQYKIQQRQLELAYSQVENSLDVFRAPPVPTTNPTNAAGNAAALTQQLLNAQRSLPQAQNALYTVWINYLVRRLQLYRDLELMPLDARGVWIDELSQCQPPRERTEPGPDADHGEPLPAPRTLPEVEAQAPAPAR